MKDKIICIILNLLIFQGCLGGQNNDAERDYVMKKGSKIATILGFGYGPLAIGIFSVSEAIKRYSYNTIVSPRTLIGTHKAAKSLRGMGYISVISYTSFILAEMTFQAAQRLDSNALVVASSVFGIPAMITAYGPAVFLALREYKRELQQE